MLNIRKFLKAIGLVPNSTSTITAQGEMEYRSDLTKLSIHDGTSADSVVQEAKSATLTNKSINAASNTITNITNTEISASAAIADTKLATISTAGKVSNSATTATDVNTASAIVARDASGNFTAGTITAALSGNATTATTAGNVSGIVAPDHGGTGVANNAAATLTRSGNHAVTLTTTNTTSVTLPTAGTLSTLAGSESLSNKTFSDSITGAQIATPSSPSSGFDKLYFKSDDKLYTLSSAGVETAVGTGSGGAINYILNPDAESATTGWATYADAAGNVPVDGTGGTATGLTFARSTSSPLRGSASFTITQANSTSLQGKGVSYDFTINSADQARMLSIGFDYNASSTFVASNGTTAPLNDGTTTTNAGNSDLEVFIYDVTNAKLIPVSPQVLTANGTNNYQYVGEFQTASNSTSYRLILHVATTSANATGWTVKYDNVSVGPQTKLLGPPVTDWTSYVPTYTNGGTATFTTSRAQYRRVGDSIEIQAVITLTASGSGSSIFTVSVPTGITPDTAKLGTSVESTLGYARYYNGTNTLSYAPDFNTAVSSSAVFFSQAINAAAANLKGSDLVNTGVLNFSVVLPIAGWSSTTTMSNDTDTRVVDMVAYKNGGSVTLNTNIPTWTGINKDSHGSFNLTTGSYTIPVSGDYNITFNYQCTTSAGTSSILKNNVVIATGITSGGHATVSTIATGCVSGDSITVQQDTSTTNSATTTGTLLIISRLSGPATIAASESVNAKYTNSASTSIGTSDTIIPFDTKVYDSHNAYATGTGLYTVPVSGKYKVTSNVFSNSIIWTAVNQSVTLRVYKNGAVDESIGRQIIQATGTYAFALNGSETVNCLAGDTLAIYAISSVAGSLNGVTSQNYVCIERVGQ